MVKIPRRYPWLALATLIVLFSMWSAAIRAQGILYQVEGEQVHLEVERSASLGTEKVGSTAMFTLTRSTDDDTALYYSLSELLNESGDVFPRDMLVVKTPYDPDWQAFTSTYGLWNSFDDQICLLDAREDSSDICLGLKGEVDAWAGTYQGRLYSDEGPDIFIELVVPTYTIATLSPDTIHVVLDHGPDWYELGPFDIWVGANHKNWIATLYSEGLIYQGDKYSNVPPLELYLPGEDVPLSEGYVITGNGEHVEHFFTIEMVTEAGWQHPAGDYRGTLFVEVQGYE
ncbi:MAG: hypothetical protein GX249_07210 [Firmicutes bacterium]|nr:hypothetical protein [Bacillota bacterium]